MLHKHYFGMSHSFKHFPAGTCCCCKSQHRGKKNASRRFRRRTKILISQGKFDKLPFKSIEITSTWDLGGDGKMFWGFYDPTTKIYRGRKHGFFVDPTLWWEMSMRK